MEAPVAIDGRDTVSSKAASEDHCDTLVAAGAFVEPDVDRLELVEEIRAAPRAGW
jgi:hypothetical protein